MSNWLIPIHPAIELKTNCPKDKTALTPIRFSISGIHSMVEAKCEQCNTTYITDLPVGQAIWSPVTIDQTKLELYDPMDVPFFSKALFSSFQNKNTEEIIPIVYQNRKFDRIVIVNCLDYLYGHSLLKLLNVQYYLDNFKNIGVCVLAPTSLIHLVPDGVAEIWEFKVPFKKMQQWFSCLESWVTDRLNEYSECFLSPAFSHPNNKNYDLNKFVNNNFKIPVFLNNQKKPVILFNYREDRLWGKNKNVQFFNIRQLFNQLKKIFPQVMFVLIGIKKDKYQFDPGIADFTTDKVSIEHELRWLSYMKMADCTIGVHGSNMLLPTGFAKTTVELVPLNRYGNVVQDLLFRPDCLDVREALLKYKLVYGNNSLSNIRPRIVTDLIVSNLSYSELNFLWFYSTDVNEKLQLFVQSELFKRSEHYLHQRFNWKYFLKSILRLSTWENQNLISLSKLKRSFLEKVFSKF